MQRLLFVCLSMISLFISACSSKVSSGSTSNTSHKKNEKVYEEDLALYLPKFKALNQKNDSLNIAKAKVSKTYTSEGPLQINKKLDAVLDTIALKNKSIRYANGFRIQIYVGNDRKLADEAKIYTYQTYPEIFPYLTYQQPIYKVKIGDFLNRMDAERYFASIKDLYPSALILPDKVEIKRGIMVK